MRDGENSKMRPGAPVRRRDGSGRKEEAGAGGRGRSRKQVAGGREKNGI